MAIPPPITSERFPAQAEHFGASVVVAFPDNLAELQLGEIIRADAEQPNVTIIILDDGRTLLGSECLWSLAAVQPRMVTRENEKERREALQAEINAALAAVPDDEWPLDQSGHAQAIAEDIAGEDWKLLLHSSLGKRPTVFVGKFVGEYAEAAPA